jgi:hypothetical protein
MVERQIRRALALDFTIFRARFNSCIGIGIGIGIGIACLIACATHCELHIAVFT